MVTSDVFPLIADEDVITHVYNFTINLCGHCKYPLSISMLSLPSIQLHLPENLFFIILNLLDYLVT